MEKLPEPQINLSLPDFEMDADERMDIDEEPKQKLTIPNKLSNQFEREWQSIEGVTLPHNKYVNTATPYDDSISFYMRSIGRYPLLTKEGEAILSSLISEGKSADPETEEYWKGIWAKDKLVLSNLRLVVSIAKRYSKSDGTVPLLDLVQEGAIGLERAASKFDARKGFKFSTYATWWIKQAIGRSGLTLNTTMHVPHEQKDLIRKIFRIMTELESAGKPVTADAVAREAHIDEKKAERAMHLGKIVTSVSLSKPIDTYSGSEENSGHIGDVFGDIDENYDVVESRASLSTLRALMEELNDKERDILMRRYGFFGQEQQSYREISKAYGVTHEAIRLVEKRTLKKMRESGVLDDLLREL